MPWTNPGIPNRHKGVPQKMNSLNRKTIIKICNIACIALTALLIILQFIPFQIEVIIKNVDDATIKLTSIATIVWNGPFLDMQSQHIPILLFGVISIIFSIINIRSTFSGVFAIIAAISGLQQTTIVHSLFQENIFASMLISPAILVLSILIILVALVLCVCQVWKIITWCTVSDEKYRSMWGVR